MTENIAFVFPGQGSQEVGMGAALMETSAAARAVFEKADEILGVPLSRVCFEGPEEELNDTYNTQPALFVTSIAVLEAMREAGYQNEPKYVAGHSLGEYSAYVAAGVLGFEDGLRLVRERGRLMKQAGELNPGSMAAILKLDDDKVAEICQEVTSEGYGTLQVANYNSSGQIVISGDDKAVDKGVELALAAKARRAVKLPVSIAAHSELMRVVADSFREAIDQAPLNLPEMPIIANITAQPLESLEAIREEMEGQLTSSVRWSESVQWMIDHGVDTFLEIGSKDVLKGLIRRIDKSVKTVTVGSPDEIKVLV
ncbi:MAG: ACP S-malonyltransferase [Thermomicrobiales bacterium]|nr:ACP S-malonyltransferase [Thermomicrobiales bacterium]